MNKQIFAALSALPLAGAAGLAHAAGDPVADIFGAIDFAGVTTALVPILVLGIGIAVAFKAGVLGKRAVRSA